MWSRLGEEEEVEEEVEMEEEHTDANLHVNNKECTGIQQQQGQYESPQRGEESILQVCSASSMLHH